jgi:hypothetical protein
MQHRIETRVENNGTIILQDLPFHAGDRVIVVITTRPQNSAQSAACPLRGLPVEYKNPFDPVAENDWEALS